MSGAELGPVWIGVVIAATITAAVTALGWFVTHAREASRDATRRSGRIVDVQKALRAEIRAHLSLLEQNDLHSHVADVQKRLEIDPDDVPIPPRENHDAIFHALVADVHILPTDAVEPVVRYYSHLAGLSAFAEDLRTPLFRRLTADRRALAYFDLVGMKLAAIPMARDAEAALNDGIEATARPDRWISIRDEDRGGS